MTASYTIVVRALEGTSTSTWLRPLLNLIPADIHLNFFYIFKYYKKIILLFSYFFSNQIKCFKYRKTFIFKNSKKLQVLFQEPLF